MAFVAITDTYPPKWGWLLFIATIIWTTAYDTMYSMVDRKDDINIGVKSTAILFGSSDRIIIGVLQIFVLFALISVGTQADLRYWYFCSLFLVALFFIYQQILIHARKPQDCFDAFLNNNYVGLIILLGIAASYWLPI
jgi:4-hydroxybenzoate polyprenyltransferase